MRETIYRCRICGSLMRDNTGGYFYSKEDLSVCQECRDMAKPVLRSKDEEIKT